MFAGKSARRLLPFATLAGLALSLVLFVHFKVDSLPFSVDTASSPQPAVGMPARLSIPKIRVDARIEHVGLTSDGDMGVPRDPDNAAWYKHGPRPGKRGNAVIDGHFDWNNGTPAVFDDLHKLRVGDRVFVKDESGKSTAFVVRKLKKYLPEQDATDVFVSDNEGIHLNLITCIGIWNQNKQSYSNRLVVFTDLETTPGRSQASVEPAR